MIKSIERLPEIKLVGITARTSNAHERNPETAKIPGVMQKFFGSDIRKQILGRRDPRTVFAVYTNYESDEHGEYTYFLGEQVSSFENVSQGFESLTIPTQDYVMFTSDAGEMPGVCIGMWEKIWKMNAAELDGVRTYKADFEIYDERSLDPKNTVLDIYVGIKRDVDLM